VFFTSLILFWAAGHSAAFFYLYDNLDYTELKKIFEVVENPDSA
jgi:hypothetical protein